MKPPLVIFARLLVLLLSLSGCSRHPAPASAPVPVVTTTEEHDKAYKEGCALINPYLILHNVKPKPIDAEARAKITQGLQWLGAVTKFAPANWSAHWMCGKAHQALGDSPAACEAFKQAFDIQKSNPDVAREYMFECLNLGRGAEGLRAAKIAVELKPTDPGLHANLALAHLVAGDAPAALKAVDEALRLDPSDPISKNVKRATQEIIEGRRPLPKKLGDLGG